MKKINARNINAVGRASAHAGMLIIFLSIALFILSGCSGGEKIVSKDIQFLLPEPGTIKAMTFNIRVGTAPDFGNRWSNRKQMVVDRLTENAADVVGLQEALSFQLSEIKTALPQYNSYAAGRNDGKQRGEACAILYRQDRFELNDSGTFWFSKTPSKPGSRRWGNLFPRICSWVHLTDTSNGKGFYVYNVHLDNVSQSSRKKSVRQLASSIAQRSTDDPFIVMGDFNMEIDNSAMKYLQKIEHASPYPKMIDAWSSLHGDYSSGTYHKFRGKSTGPKIDHIPMSESVKALDVRIDTTGQNGKYPSDHFPVTAIIKLI
jgi:endonuclease/exonuclease/phosphatase family metal-dependent hydrolase